MSVFVWIILSIGLISFLTWLLSRSSIYIAWAFFLGAPIALSIYWMAVGIEAHLLGRHPIYTALCANKISVYFCTYY